MRAFPIPRLPIPRLPVPERREEGSRIDDVPPSPTCHRTADESPDAVFPGQLQKKQSVALNALIQRGYKQGGGPNQRPGQQAGYEARVAAGQRKPGRRPSRGLVPQGHPHAAE